MENAREAIAPAKRSYSASKEKQFIVEIQDAIRS